VVEQSLSRVAAGLVSPVEIEAVRARVVALRSLPARPHLGWHDVLTAFRIFLIVVISTFPVVLPFLMMQDVTLAQNVSRAIALAMLFFGGLALGRYAGYGSWRVGLIMAALGTALIVAINALGG
jgi:VIT1/CCC1 family predicted Fe2+/Mn2+ transporter